MKHTVRKSFLEPLTLGQRILVGVMGLGFLAAGSTLLFFFLKDCLYGAWRTRDRITVPALLHSIEVAQSGRTRSLDVRYDYTVNGRPYSATRVALFKPSMPFRWQLFAAEQRGTPIQVFIDPRHPEFAVIDRDFSFWPTVVAVPFSLAFTLVGGWLLVAAVRAPKADGRRKLTRE